MKYTLLLTIVFSIIFNLQESNAQDVYCLYKYTPDLEQPGEIYSLSQEGQLQYITSINPAATEEMDIAFSSDGQLYSASVSGIISTIDISTGSREEIGSFGSNIFITCLLA